MTRKNRGNGLIPTCVDCPFCRDTSIQRVGYCTITRNGILPHDECWINYDNITTREAVRILHHAQKYRRGKKKMPLPSPYLLGVAIDKSINILREKINEKSVQDRNKG